MGGEVELAITGKVGKGTQSDMESDRVTFKITNGRPQTFSDRVTSKITDQTPVDSAQFLTVVTRSLAMS